MKNSQILKQLGVFDTVTDITGRRPGNTAKNIPETAVAAGEEDEEPAEEVLEHPPTVSVLSKEQALQLLKPRRERARSRSLPGDSLEGKFVNLVDFLPAVPTKGEFDVNKIKSSIYFFS